MLSLKSDLKIVHKFAAINYIATRGSRSKKPVPEVGKTTYVYKNVPEYPHPEEFEKDEFKPRRLAYWPEGIGQLRPRSTQNPWARVKNYITIYPPEEKIVPEYTETPLYPEIDDFRIDNLTPDDERRNRRKWYKQIEALPTFEQKMFEIIDIKQHQTVNLKAWSHIFDNLPVYKRLTNTRLVNTLPENYHTDTPGQEKLKESIMDAIALHLSDANEKRYGAEARRKLSNVDFSIKKADVMQVENLIEEIASVCIKNLSSSHGHLLGAQVCNSGCRIIFNYQFDLDRLST